MKTSVSFLTVLFVLAGHAAYGQSPPPDVPNVILISIDTLRPDHLGCYGYPRNTSPHIDEFRKDAALFSKTISQSSTTTLAHASIFTSLIPSHHKASSHMKKAIPQKIVTMAEIFKARGYATISFNGGARVEAKFGFEQGFDVYESYYYGGFEKQVDQAINWIRRNPDRKTFFFLHTYETHIPYEPEGEILELFEKEYSGNLPDRITRDHLDQTDFLRATKEEDQKHVINLYDAEIYSMDRAFGALMDFLKKEDYYDDTIVVFTSDHGEELGERGQMAKHAHTLYEELIQVPLIIKFQDSRFAGKTIAAQARSIDILPTLIELLRIKDFDLDRLEGASLMPLLRGEGEADRYAVSQIKLNTELEQGSIQTTRWKLYESQLFDLKADPLEQRDVSAENAEIGRQLAARLRELLAKDPYENVMAPGVDLDKETLEELRSLGYLQ